jgi:hypothetical protein
MVEAGGLTEKKGYYSRGRTGSQKPRFFIEYFVIAPRNDQKPGFEALSRRPGFY